MKKLILSNLSNIANLKNCLALGPWIRKEKIMCLDYHWSNKKKVDLDHYYLKRFSEKIIYFLAKQLNIVHEEKKSIRYWRVILCPWIFIYLSVMYDRWETIKNLVKKNKFYNCDHIYLNKIFINFGLVDFQDKATFSDLWNHSNFIRIIKFLEIKKIKFLFLKKKFFFKKKNYFKEIHFLLKHIDNFLSYISMIFNSIMIESFYISKKDFLKLVIRLKIIPCFFKNFFTSKAYDNDNIDIKTRDQIFETNSNKKNFYNFFMQCLKNDFPITYIENYKAIKKDINSKGFQIKKVKKIFSMISFINNEVFKIWLANKIESGSKFIAVAHGGCLNTKLTGYFDYYLKIADKVILHKKPLNSKEIQMPLFKFKKNTYIQKIEKKNIYIFDCEPVNYPFKIQSWPYISEKQKIIKITEDLFNFFLKKKKNIVYRTMNNGRNFTKIMKKKIPNIKTSDLYKVRFNEIKKDIGLAVCMYPETVIVDLITSGVPTVIYMPKKLYSFDNNSLKMIKYLTTNKIYFDNFNSFKNHVNKIINSPLEWWYSKSNQLVIKKFQENFFKVDKNYILKWEQLIKKI